MMLGTANLWAWLWVWVTGLFSLPAFILYQPLDELSSTSLASSLNAACSMELDQFSCYQTLWSAHPPSPHQSQLDCLAQVMFRAYSPDFRRGYTTYMKSQLSSSHALRTGSPMSPPIGSALMCLQDEMYVHGEGWSHLFRVKGGSSPVAVSSEG